MDKGVLLAKGKDSVGLVERISDEFRSLNCNITEFNYRVLPQEGYFAARVSFDSFEFLDGLSEMESTSLPSLRKDIKDFNYSLEKLCRKKMAGLLVSKETYCAREILHQQKNGELDFIISSMISNHDLAYSEAKTYGLPFHELSITKENKKEDELLEQTSGTDFLILARYMQILSSDFIKSYGKPIINIHHGLLPAFKGGNPYKQAFDRGVKLIGATAHYVTEEVDEGPIIYQAVRHVAPFDSIDELKQKGRSAECEAITSALKLFLDNRLIEHNKRVYVL